LQREADFGEAEEDDAEDRAGVFLGLEAGVGAELIRGIPEAFFERAVGRVLFGWGNPVHGVGRRVFQTVSPAIQNVLGSTERAKIPSWARQPAFRVREGGAS
jgi:hypothetical protein